MKISDKLKLAKALRDILNLHYDMKFINKNEDYGNLDTTKQIEETKNIIIKISQKLIEN